MARRISNEDDDDEDVPDSGASRTIRFQEDLSPAEQEEHAPLAETTTPTDAEGGISEQREHLEEADLTPPFLENSWMAGEPDDTMMNRVPPSVRPQRRGSATHNPDVVRMARSTITTFDHTGHAMTEAEQVAFRRERGRCTRCGEVKTHRKVKHGPFNLFRRMEPLTIRNRVYKGYCLQCYDIHEIEQELGHLMDDEEGFTRASSEISRDGTESTRRGDCAVSFNNECGPFQPPELRGHVMYDDEDDSYSEKDNPLNSCLSSWRAQVCLIVVVLLGFALVIAIATMAFNSNDEVKEALRDLTPSPTMNPTDSPTQAPTSFYWRQMGDDILPEDEGLSNSGDSFGAIVKMSNNGKRIAIAAPLYRDSTGWVQVYDYVDITLVPTVAPTAAPTAVVTNITEGTKTDAIDTNLTTEDANITDDYTGSVEEETPVEKIGPIWKWVPVGLPIVGDSIGGADGMVMDLSADGSTLALGFPGNGNGFVRIYRFQNKTGEFNQMGQTLIGHNDGDKFGASVSMVHDGENIVIGAPEFNFLFKNGDVVNAAGMVAAYKFDQDTKEWSLVSEINNNLENERFGQSLCMADERRMFYAGAPGNSQNYDNAGSVYAFIFGPDSLGNDVFVNANTDPYKETYQQVLGGISGESSNDSIGKTLACNANGDWVLVALEHEDEVRNYYLGLRWTRGSSLMPAELRGTGSGNAIDFSGEGTLTVTGTKNQDGLSGRVFMFEPDGVFWDQVGDPVEGETLGEDRWITGGPAVDLSSDASTVAIGYESIMLDGHSQSVVRVYRFGAYAQRNN